MNGIGERFPAFEYDVPFVSDEVEFLRSDVPFLTVGLLRNLSVDDTAEDSKLRERRFESVPVKVR
jgi:hypothetical protein